MTSLWTDLERPRVMAIAKELRSSALTRTAVMQGKNVSYIKGAKLVGYVQGKGGSVDDARALGNALLREDLVMKAEILDQKKKMLRPAHQNPKAFEGDDSFLVWNFEGSTGMRNLLLIIIVLAFFGLVLFPVWPQNAKVGVWYVSMTLLLVLLGFITVRLVLFFILYAVGIDFWILPNFFADDAGFWDSFRPVYSFHFSLQNIKDSWQYRLAVVACVGAIVYWVYTQPTEFDEFVASQRAFVDELYEGTLLADKSQKEKEQIDKVIPDYETVQRELDELEKLSKEEQKEAKVMEDLLERDGKSSEQADDEIADL